METKSIVNTIMSGMVLLFISCGQGNGEVTPMREDITVTVFASGTLEARNSYELTARSEGYLKRILVAENDTVSEGQVLALIDNEQHLFNAERAERLYRIAQSNMAQDAPQLAKARNGVTLAKEQLLQDSLLSIKYRTLWDANAVAQVDFDNVNLQYLASQKEYRNALKEYEFQRKQAREQLIINQTQRNVNATLSAFNSLKAVKAGKVYKMLKEEGDYVKQGDVIGLIGDAHTLFAEVSIDERSIGKITVGQDARIVLNVDKTKQYRGKVSKILPAFDEATQSFVAELTFGEPLDFKVVDTQLQATIIVEQVTDALLIPREFLGYGNEVMIKGNNTPTVIETRVVSTEWVQVLSGIDENTILVKQKP